MMTVEEIQQVIKELEGDLDKLSKLKEPLPKQEKRQKRLLLLKKDTLCKIKEAREQGDDRRELNQTVRYGLLNSWVAKYPFLMRSIMSKIGWDSYW